MDMLKVLVVDNEKRILRLLKMNLEKSGYEVITGSTGMEAITKTNTLLPDLILLDTMLPDIDGLEICNMLKLNKKTKDIPIIMITARSKESDKVKGLESGADDYITKPFGVKELDARINTILRRYSKDINIEDNNNIIEFKDLIIDPTIYHVKKNNKEVELTLTEFRILRSLAENRHKVMSRKELLESVGVGKIKSDNRVVDVHIRNIRKKLKDKSGTKYIKTIRGIGYRINWEDTKK